MTYEYLAQAPYVGVTFFAAMAIAFFAVGALFFIMAMMKSLADGEFKLGSVFFILTLILSGGAFLASGIKEPERSYEMVTAKLTDSGFTRDEKTGKHSYATAGYLAYAIEDGSNLIYYQRIGDGSVIAERIYLYKVKKESK